MSVKELNLPKITAKIILKLKGFQNKLKYSLSELVGEVNFEISQELIDTLGEPENCAALVKAEKGTGHYRPYVANMLAKRSQARPSELVVVVDQFLREGPVDDIVAIKSAKCPTYLDVASEGDTEVVEAVLVEEADEEADRANKKKHDQHHRERRMRNKDKAGKSGKKVVATS